MIASAAGSSYAMGIVKLKNWDERPNPEDEVQAVIGQIYARTADIKTPRSSPWLRR